MNNNTQSIQTLLVEPHMTPAVPVAPRAPSDGAPTGRSSTSPDKITELFFTSGKEEVVVQSWNEWDKLQEVIIGRPDGYCVPADEPAVRVKSNGRSNSPDYPNGTYSEDSIRAATVQTEGLVRTLEEYGVTVRRPSAAQCDFAKPSATSDWRIPNQSGVGCPRDVLTVVGNEIIEAPMSWRARYFEFRPYRSLLNEYFKRDPMMLWTAAPKPLMDANLYRADYPECVGPERKACTDRHEYILTEAHPCFDAADAVRCGRDIFMQQGFTTNEAGIDWFTRHARGRARVHPIRFENNVSPTHTDAELTFLRPGLAMQCPERPLEKEYLDLITGHPAEDGDAWEVVMAPEPTTRTMPHGCTSSPWLSMNLLSIDEDTVIVEASETPMIKFLEEEMSMTVVPVPFRDVYKFGGAFHCQSCDIRRDGAPKEHFAHLARNAERAAGPFM